jgi:predicted Zn-dependent protease
MKQFGSLLIVLMGTTILCSCTSNKVDNEVTKYSVFLKKDNPWFKDSLDALAFDSALDECQSQNFDRAQVILDRLNKMEPNNPLVLNAFGNILVTKMKPDSAIGYFEQSLKVDSTMLATYANYGLALYQAKRYDDALSIYYRAIRLKRISDSGALPVLYTNIALYYDRFENCDSAEKYIQIAEGLSIVARNDVKEKIEDAEADINTNCQTRPPVLHHIGTPP